MERKGGFVSQGSRYPKIAKDRKERCRCIIPEHHVQSLGLSAAHGEAGYHQEREKGGEETEGIVEVVVVWEGGVSVGGGE